jgi:hypothetical protein
MKRIYSITCLLFACEGGDDVGDDVQELPLQCRSAGYVAFDPANHASQDLRLGAHADMVARMNEAVADPSVASARFAAARGLYMSTADLQAKVKGRKDDHFAELPAIGAELDATILDGLSAGETATTALAANLAKQKVDKTLLHFFYLSVFHEMVQGERAKWDEAFGYFGSGATNTEAARKGLASVATKRDANNNTTLAESIFNGIVDGSCDLSKRADMKLDYRSVPELSAIVERVDGALLEVLAYSAGHEAFEMVEIQEMLEAAPSAELRDEMWVKLSELDPYFRPLEPILGARGGADATRAQEIRAAIDAAWSDPSGAWIPTFDAQGVVERLEAAFAIDIKG